VQARCFDELRALGEQLATEVVEKFCEVDLAGIGNKTGFFMGICRRYRERASATAMNVPAYTGLGPSDATAQTAFNMLPNAVQARFGDLYTRGVVPRDEIDAQCFQSMLDFPERKMMEIADKFASTDLATIRNRTGFLIGIMKRYRRDGFDQNRGPSQDFCGKRLFFRSERAALRTATAVDHSFLLLSAPRFN